MRSSKFRAGKQSSNEAVGLKPKVLVIVGPNASGKSSLAIELAKKLNGEVISADSRQVYKGLNIGSGKVTKAEMEGVPHHMIDIVGPKKVFTVSDFKKHGKRALGKVLGEGKLPIIAGGTGFYIDALIYDMEIPQIPPQRELREKLEKISKTELLERLNSLDPRRAETIDKENKRRLVRAVEIVETTGKPVPELDYKKAREDSPYDVLKIGINWPDKVLRERIRERLHKRMNEGMVEEVKKLHDSHVRRGRGVSWERLDDLGLEYRYIARYLQGFLSKEELLETLETEIWRYAKRQMTWFKRDKSILWLDPATSLPSTDSTSSPQAGSGQAGQALTTSSTLLEKALPIVRDFLGREGEPSPAQ